jgi:hypothetical protein
MPPRRHTATSESFVWWRWTAGEGHEAASVRRANGGWELAGATVFRHAGISARLDYVITCDARWKTRHAIVTGWLENKRVRHDIVVTADGRWIHNDRALPALDGCVDIDLNFSPITNTLPIRRLALRREESAPVSAAWLRFPSLRLERLEQTYARLGARRYRYTSGGGRFTAELTTDAAGIVLDYPPQWQRVGGPSDRRLSSKRSSRKR